MKKKWISFILTVSILASLLACVPMTTGAYTGSLTDGTLYYEIINEEVTITDCATSVSGALKIPSVLSGFPVTSIGSSAFSACTGLTSVTIPNGVTSIEDRAFGGCTGLTSVTIPNGVTIIEDYAFSGCTALNSILLPNSVTGIGRNAFYNTAYYNDPWNWEDDVLYLGSWLIGAKTSLSGACQIPKGTKRIADYAFSGCKSLTSVTIPDSVTSIGNSAFYDCSKLTSVTIPDSVTSIGNSAFSACSTLTSVTIPDSVTSIGTSAFYNCSKLTSVKITDLAAWCGITFSDSDSNPLRYAHNLYLNGSLVTNLVIPDSVTSIENYAFHGCSKLTSVTIPDSVTSIGSGAFAGCTGLATVTIPFSVTSIENYAFNGCTKLKSVYYGGTQEDWSKVSIGSNNDPLKNATVYDTAPRIAAYGVSAVKDAESKVALERFVWKFKTTVVDQIKTLGAYLIPWEMFGEDIKTNGTAATYSGSNLVTAEGEAIMSGNTFAADIANIPEALYDHVFYAYPFVNGKVYADAKISASVNSVSQN